MMVVGLTAADCIALQVAGPGLHTPPVHATDTPDFLEPRHPPVALGYTLTVTQHWQQTGLELAEQQNNTSLSHFLNSLPPSHLSRQTKLPSGLLCLPSLARPDVSRGPPRLSSCWQITHHHSGNPGDFKLILNICRSYHMPHTSILRNYKLWSRIVVMSSLRIYRLDFSLRKDFSKNKISPSLPIVLCEYSLKSRKINHKNLTLSNMSRPSIDFIVVQ